VSSTSVRPSNVDGYVMAPPSSSIIATIATTTNSIRTTACLDEERLIKQLARYKNRVVIFARDANMGRSEAL
jgi:hypothetical protein